jgi:hypothetical protein
MCRCTANTVRYWIHLGKLTTIKPGKKRLIEEPSLRKLMADNRKGVPLARPERSQKPSLALDDLIPTEFGCDFDSPAQRRRR